MSERKCGVWWCDEKHYADGLCFNHYTNARRNGDVISPKYRDAYAIRAKAEEMAREARELLIFLTPFMYNSDGDCLVCGSLYGSFHNDDCLLNRFFIRSYEISNSQNQKTKE